MQVDQSELICLVSQRTHLFVHKIAAINEAGERESSHLPGFKRGKEPMRQNRFHVLTPLTLGGQT